MGNYDDHVQFAQNIVITSQLQQSQTTKLYELIQRIQQRQNDPNLYLAVIGEFSSGKSTFVNALIRDSLLKTSALVTTATATKLKYGKNIYAEVHFRNVPSIFLKKTNTTFKIIICFILIWLVITFIFKLYFILIVVSLFPISFLSIIILNKKSTNPKNVVTSKDIIGSGIKVRDFITKVTSEEEIAKEVQKLVISHPASFLKNNIVIIDLPGTNAPNTRHAQVTQEIVEKEADIAIIIIPATQPLTDSLAEFLIGTIRPYLHRCIFVVTRMDQIRQREHNKMLDNIQNRLVDKLKINPSQLYSCSAQVVMDSVDSEQHRVEKPDFWIEQFTQMQVQIIERLQSQRKAIINENIQNLFNQLFEQIKKHLQSQWNEYRKKETHIQKEIIQDLESFKNQQYKECINMVDRAINRTENKINDHIEKYRILTLSKVQDSIFSTNNWDELKYVVNTKVSIILREQQNLLSGNIENECRNLFQATQEVGQYFDKKFTEVYRSLQALDGRIETNSVFSSNTISISTYSVIASAQQLNSSNFGNAMAGFLSHLFRGLLDDRKQKVWNEIRPKIYDYFSEIKKQVQPAIKKDADNFKTAINKRISDYITHYKFIIDNMLNKQKVELQRLTQLQAKTQADLAEIERRKLQIKINST